MKTFRYPLGHVDMVTMTVAELREKLNEYPQDMPVIAEWEGTWNSISAPGFEVRRFKHGHPDDSCDCLIIDVDTH